MRPEIFSIGLLLAAALPAQEVTLPLAHYEKLRLDAIEEPAPAPRPPVPVAFEEAVLEVVVGSTSARITQELTLELYSDRWQTVPLAALGTFIAADFDALEGRLDGALEVRGRGRHRVRLTSVMPVSRDETATRPTWRLELQAPRAAVVRGTLEISSSPQEQLAGPIEEVTAAGPAIIGEAAGGGRRPWLAEPGGRFVLTLYGAAAVPERVRLPLRFDAVSATVLEVSRSRRRLAAWITLRVLQGELETFAVPLPAGFEVVSVDGPVAGWDIEAGRLTVTPLAAVTDRLAVEVELAGGPADELASPVLAVDGAAGLLKASKIQIAGDGVLDLLDAGAARQPDARQEARLPAAFRHAPGLALVVPRESAAATWRLTWSESTEVLAAQVDRMLVDVIVGTHGRAAYQLWAEVRSSGAPQLALALPASELVAGRRDGAPILPGRSSAGWVVPLSATAQRQVIHLSFILPLVLPSGNGELDLPLPVLSAPVARVEARIILPGGRRPGDRLYELADTSRYGSVGPVPGAAVPGEVPLVARQLSLAGADARRSPAADLFPLPPGFAPIEAAWSALSPSPAPLRVRVKSDLARKEWF